MADFRFLESRIIQRRGIIRIPNDWARYNPLLLFADVVVLPRSYSVSFRYQPSKGRWSSLNFMDGGRVTRQLLQEYTFQRFTVFDYTYTQYAESLNCTERNILAQISAIGISSQPPVTTNTEPVLSAGGSSLPLLGETEILVTTEADSRVLFNLYEFPAYVCETLPLPKTPAPSPPLPLPLSFDDPTKDQVYPVSTPYDPPDDNGFTYVPPVSLPTCFSFTGTGATTSRPAGQPITSNGSPSVGYFRGSTATFEFGTIPSGFYAGSLGWLGFIDGDFVYLSATEITLANADGNPNCPA